MKLDTMKPAPGTWMTITRGTFTMGANTSEPCQGSAADEHTVTLTRDFIIQSTETTQEQFLQRMGYNPSQRMSCPSCPVDTVSWHEVAAYCNALSAYTGRAFCYTCNGVAGKVACDVDQAYALGNIYACPGYRLPTEAEWEFAYRAGTTTDYYNGDRSVALCESCNLTDIDPNADQIAWYCVNSGGEIHPVGGKIPNAWGLYDMAGNVGEWCHDRYTTLGGQAVADPWGASNGANRVLRPGSNTHPADRQSASYRWGTLSTDRFGDVGARCVRTLFP